MLLNSLDIWTVQKAVLAIVFIGLPLVFLTKIIYNLFLHPLRKYPGPLLARTTLLPSAYHAIRGDFYLWLSRAHDKYGPTVRLAPAALSFTSPAAWQDIYNAKPQLPKAKFSFPPPQKGESEGILMADDDKHARLRRLIGPGFSGKAIEEMEPVLQEKTGLLVTGLREAGGGGKEMLNMQDWAQFVVTDIIGVLAMGVEFECLERRRHHVWPSMLNKSLKTMMWVNVMLRFGLKQVVAKLLSSKRAKEAARGVLGESERFVKARLEREKTEEGKQQKDIIGLVLRDQQDEKEPLDEREVFSMSITLVGAGSETTSAALTGVMYYLVHDPPTLQKLAAEVREAFDRPEDITVKGVAKLPYLQGVVEEGLRLFIPAPSLPPRVSPKDGHTVDGEWIPPNTNMVMANYHNSHSNRFFSEAEKFRPERWLPREAGGTDGVHVKNAYQPFSFGPRNCVGRLLAITELRLIIAKMVWHFDIELAEPVTEWLETAQFFIAWEMKPLMVRFRPREIS